MRELGGRSFRILLPFSMAVLYVILSVSGESAANREGFQQFFSGQPPQVPLLTQIANIVNLPAVMASSVIWSFVPWERVVPEYIPVITPVLGWRDGLAGYHVVTIILLLLMWHLVGRGLDRLFVKYRGVHTTVDKRLYRH